MSRDSNALGDLRGMAVVGPDGEAVGKVVDLFSDQLTGRPEWVLVRGEGQGDDRNDRFVPLVESSIESGTVAVPYGREQVTSAPDVGGAGHLNVDDEAQLYVHYGLDPWEHGAKSGGRAGGTPTGVPLAAHSDAGPDGPAADDDGAAV